MFLCNSLYVFSVASSSFWTCSIHESWTVFLLNCYLIYFFFNEGIVLIKKNHRHDLRLIGELVQLSAFELSVIAICVWKLLLCTYLLGCSSVHSLNLFLVIKKFIIQSFQLIVSLFLLTVDSTAEHPTLLHFASEFGLSRLVSNLLLYPGAQEACKIRNYHGQDPHEIAEVNGYQELANTLCSFHVSISLTMSAQCQYRQ